MSAQPKIVFLHDQATYPLVRGIPLTLGRSHEGPVEHAQHVRLAHREMAPHHCQVSWDGIAVIFAPLQAEFPCYINGQVVTEAVPVDHGDILTFGPFNIELDAPEHELFPAEAEPMLPPSLVGTIPLEDGLTIGCGPSCSVPLESEEFADYPDGAFQVLVEEAPEGFRVGDRGTEPSWLNGQLFSDEDLIIGDYLQIGSQNLRFDGRSFVGVSRTLGAELHATGIYKAYGETKVLQDASFDAPSGQFIGILGPSGSGKTTLLKVISGIENLQGGQVLVNGVDLFENLSYCRSLMGYVPQDDIVHEELTVWEAMAYSAYLRLPDWTSDREIHKLIVKILESLGLYRPEKNIDHTRKRLTELSGGQRKRVSVAVELLNRPQILFLDEPTSGLDPGMEFELMSTLRSLTQSGCTVICTTHVLENVFLMDSVAVIYHGCRVFQGDSTRARSHFDVDRLSEVYTTLDEEGQKWVQSAALALADSPMGESAEANAALEEREAAKKSTVRAIKHLLSRQIAILLADPKNLMLLLGQPFIIGLLITLAAVDEGAAITKLFLAHVATFWFGCSNAAQEIVRERAIFSREKMVGLGVNAYLLGKVVAAGGISCLQALLLFGVLRLNVHEITRSIKAPPSADGDTGTGTAEAASGLALYWDGLPGSVPWQLIAMLLTALASSLIGLALSSWAKRPAQAALAVPLIIIPQILLAGYVFPLQDWRPEDEGALSAGVKRMVGAFSAITPSGAAQKIVDTSFYWQMESLNSGTAFATPFENLRIKDWKKDIPPIEPGAGTSRKIEPAYKDVRPASFGMAILFLWCVVSYGFAWTQLRKT